MPSDAEEIGRLERRVRELEREVKVAQQNNHERNLALDALHFVWCDGGCDCGVHRWSKDVVTKELVEQAVRNTTRLVRWFNNSEFKTMPISDRFEYIRRLQATREAEQASPEVPA